MTRLSFIVIAFFLVLAACTAKLQQQSNNNTSNNPTTVDKGLQGGAGKRDSVMTIEEKTKVSFTENATNYTYVPTMDTPSILKKDNPIWQVAALNGRYHEGIWHITGGLKKAIFTPEEFMQQYILPNIGANEINELLYTHKYEADEFGIGHYYYTQYYKNIPTTHQFSLTTKDGFAGSFESTFDPSLSVNIVPTISEQQAWDSIKVFLAATDTKTNPLKYRGILDRYDIMEFPYKAEWITNMTYTVKLAIISSSKEFKSLRYDDHLIYLFKLSGGARIAVDPFVGKVLIYNNMSH